MNAVWGESERPLDLEELDRKLANGPKNNSPKTPLAWCLKNKKTLRLGNKTDPFQPIERKEGRSLACMDLLIKHNWSFVVQTRFTRILRETGRHRIRQAHKLGLITIMPIISPGLDRDWALLERKRTTPIKERMEDIRYWIDNGVPLGVNGEPFIPGFHTTKEFEETIRILKDIGVRSYNTYNFHFTPHVAKRLAREVPEIDIEKIWYYNQDGPWKSILTQLLEIADQVGMRMGCPDFVNSGKDRREPANTCCGIDVPNPTTYNSHFFKKLTQEGLSPEEIIEQTWDGTGDFEDGKKIITGKRGDFYTLKEAGLC